MFVRFLLVVTACLALSPFLARAATPTPVSAADFPRTVAGPDWPFAIELPASGDILLRGTDAEADAALDAMGKYDVAWTRPDVATPVALNAVRGVRFPNQVDAVAFP